MTKLPYVYYNLVIFLTLIEAHTMLKDTTVFSGKVYVAEAVVELGMLMASF